MSISKRNYTSLLISYNIHASYTIILFRRKKYVHINIQYMSISKRNYTFLLNSYEIHVSNTIILFPEAEKTTEGAMDALKLTDTVAHS